VKTNKEELKEELINTILKHLDFDRKYLESLHIDTLDKILADYYLFELKQKKNKN